MAPIGKETLKKILGEIPLTAELYWLLRQRGKGLNSRFSLRHVHEKSQELCAAAATLRSGKALGKNIYLFATLHYWIEMASLLGMGLASDGHRVTLGFLPYSDWKTPINRFDLRRQDVYTRKVLGELKEFVDPVSFIQVRQNLSLPEGLLSAVQEVTLYDIQYSSQVEEIDETTPLYQLRLERNTHAAIAAYNWLKAGKPDQLILPNGTIQEFGIVYRVARFLKIPVTTYEFSEQRQRIWLAQNDEVMRQNTNSLWEGRSDHILSEPQLERIKALFASRQQGALWENFTRRWQGGPGKGAAQVRAELNLDSRPVVLLATNVVGDSLTLGRQVFSRTMTEWISRTVQYFAGREDIQLVIRVHPGEMLLKGVSIADVIHQVLPRLPEHIHLVAAKDKTNTYDLIEAANLGLVYTTTVGMEMALSGVPVIVSGNTHYRNRGFTVDPDSWVNYFKVLGQMLEQPESHTLSRKQVEDAWRYAYYFYFEFPRPFPWHLWRIAEDYAAHPLETVFLAESLAQCGDTFRYLAGEVMDWKAIPSREGACKEQGE